MRPEGPKKFFWETVPPPPNLRVWMTAPLPHLRVWMTAPLPYLRVWMTAPLLSQGLDDRPPLSQGLDDRPPPLPYLKVWIRHWLKRNTLLKRWKVISIRYFT